MARKPVEGVTVHVSSAIATPFSWNIVGSVLSYDATHGNAGESERRVFGEAGRIVKPGGPTGEYSLDILFDPEDTNGQNILRSAKASGSDVAIAFIHSGTGASAKGYYEVAKVSEHTDNADADGDYVEGSISLVGNGVQVDITAGLPT